MPAPSTFIAWAESLETLSYYDILRVTEDASGSEIQEAFHALSLRCHPDRFVDDGPEVAAAASRVFKRAAEAYNILRNPAFRQRYDQSLKKGQVTLDVHAVEQKKRYEQITLVSLARAPRTKQFAAKAEQFLMAGDLESARIQLVSAVHDEPGNAALKERLAFLYAALTLEPD